MTVSGGLQHVPLSPWGYWPQMSKLENLSDFPAFRPSAPCTLFGISPSQAAESLVIQRLAVFGKKWKTSGLLGGQKGFLLREVYHHMKILSKFVLISSYSNLSEKIRRVNFLHHVKGNSPVELCGNI